MFPFEFSFSDVISLLYSLNSLRVLGRLFKMWGAFWDETVTSTDRALANEAAFFILIPLSVFLHEAGHTLATWQVGGEVVDFQWRVFWGYIVPVGNFTPLQSWWIALSGNLVSILLGLLPIPLLPRAGQTIWGEVLYAYARHELFYALVWYPAISVVGFGGDWTIIYDFSVTPYAPVTLTFHLLLLYGLRRLDKSVWAARWRIGRNPEDLVKLQQLEARMQLQPASVLPLIDLAYFYYQMGEGQLSRRCLSKAEKLSPNQIDLKVTQALIAFGQKRYHQAQKAAETALAVGDALPPDTRGRMHSILAWVYMDRGRRVEALGQYDTALSLLPGEHALYYWRGVVKRSLSRQEEARADFEQVVLLAPDEEMRAKARQELESLE